MTTRLALAAAFGAALLLPTSALAAASAVDADALAALDKMGAELRTHQNFDVKSDITMEDVLGSGQKLQYAGTLETIARRPNGFRISMVSDPKNREIYYDGRNVTVFSPRLGYYGSFAAPGTIKATLQKAKDQYGIELPLADLYAWGTDPSLVGRIKAGFFVREDHVGGRACNHYAFRQQRADWQIWIASNGPALPCKLVITNTSDPAQPQYTAVMHWSFPNSIPDSTFAFVPPSNAKKIEMATIATVRLAGGKYP